MDETINKETVAAATGAEEKPTPQASDSQAAPSAVDVDSLKSILEPMIQQEVDRRTQSIKDKRIAKQESRISTLEDTITQLKELQAEGMSEKQAIQYMRMQELLESQGINPPEVPAEKEVATQPSPAVEDYLLPILHRTGLDANDAEVIKILRTERDAAKQMNAIFDLADIRRQTQEQPANPAATLSSGGGGTVQGDTLESVEAELQAEMAKPVKDHAKIREIRLKHAELLKQQ